MIHWNITKNLIPKNSTIRAALELFLKVDLKILLCHSDGKLCGIFTDGDFIKIFREKVSLDSNVATVMNASFVSVQLNEINSLEFNSTGDFLPLVPVLNSSGFPEAILQTENKEHGMSELGSPYESNTGMTLIVMAGGKGVRLRPLTEVIPKPLIPYKGRPIIEQVIEKYTAQGINNVQISIGFMAEKFAQFVEKTMEKWATVSIGVIEETNPQGTVGALPMIFEGSSIDHAVVAYADSIVDVSTLQISTLLKQGFDLVLVVCKYDMHCPYGNIVTDVMGNFVHMDEKPTFSVNAFTGVYGISQNAVAVLANKPEIKAFDDFLSIATNTGLKITTLFVKKEKWIDLGTWEKQSENR